MLNLILIFLLPLVLAETTTTTVNSLKEVYATEYIWTNLARELTSTILFGSTVIVPLESTTTQTSTYYDDITVTATEILTITTNGSVTVETTVRTQVCTGCATTAATTVLTTTVDLPDVSGTVITDTNDIVKPTTTDVAGETSTPPIGDTTTWGLDNTSTKTVQGDTTTVVEDCTSTKCLPQQPTTANTVNVISQKADTTKTIETVAPTAIEGETVTINTQAPQATTITSGTVPIAAPTINLSIYEGNAPKVAIGMTGVLGFLALIL